MSVVLLLPGAEPPALEAPNEPLVRVLEELLEHARSGRLRWLVATGFGDIDPAGGYGRSRYATFAMDENPDVYQALGAVRWLEHELVDRITKRLAAGG